MKPLLTLLLACFAGIAMAQSQYSVSIEGNYGWRAYNRPIPFNGKYEGTTISWNHQIKQTNNWWTMQLWNTDLTRLQHSLDTTTRNAFGAEYGVGTGLAYSCMRRGQWSLYVMPTAGITYTTHGAIDATYNDRVMPHSINPVLRTQFVLNYKMFFLTYGISHQFESFTTTNTYHERTWFGIGIRQH